MQRAQRIHPRAREQRRDHFERRILRGGADQDDVAALHVGQKGVLLRLVEAVDLVDEENGAAAQAAQRLGVGHHGLDFLDAAQHRAEGDELALGDAGDQVGERGLADAGRSPQNDRGQFVALDLAAQRLAGAEDVLLADVVFEALRAHALGERAAGSPADSARRCGVEEAHARSILWRRAS